MRPERRPWGRDGSGGDSNSLPSAQIHPGTKAINPKLPFTSPLPLQLFPRCLRASYFSWLFHRTFDRTACRFLAGDSAPPEYIINCGRAFQLACWLRQLWSAAACCRFPSGQLAGRNDRHHENARAGSQRAKQDTEELLGSVIARRPRPRGISHRVKKTQREIPRCARNDRAFSWFLEAGAHPVLRGLRCPRGTIAVC